MQAGYTAVMWESLTRRLGGAGLSVDPDQAAALVRYLEEIRRWNRVHNLTAITDPDGMIRRHVLESLALRPYLKGRRVADVGSGAGVPGIPLAITEPERQFTLIESRGKRAAFLRHVQGVLGLGNVAVEHCRVESMTDNRRFDTLLARAVAPPAELLRLTAHLFGPETIMLALSAEPDPARLAELEKRYDIRRADGDPGGRVSGALLVIGLNRG